MGILIDESGGNQDLLHKGPKVATSAVFHDLKELWFISRWVVPKDDGWPGGHNGWRYILINVDDSRRLELNKHLGWLKASIQATTRILIENLLSNDVHHRMPKRMFIIVHQFILSIWRILVNQRVLRCPGQALDVRIQAREILHMRQGIQAWSQGD